MRPCLAASVPSPPLLNSLYQLAPPSPVAPLASKPSSIRDRADSLPHPRILPERYALRYSLSAAGMRRSDSATENTDPLFPVVPT